MNHDFPRDPESLHPFREDYVPVPAWQPEALTIGAIVVTLWIAFLVHMSQARLLW